jgi:uncharacterized protein (TIGR02145 family)
MKTNLLYVLSTTVLMLVGCESENVAETPDPTIDEGVEINGIVWATRNVDAPGEFADKPEDYGRYYNFFDAQSVCPAGWRTPTGDELEALCDPDKTISIYHITSNGVEGRIFADLATKTSIFMPAAGFRIGASTISDHAGKEGSYWSSVAFISDTHEGVSRFMSFLTYIDVDKDDSKCGVDGDNVSLSVRCVKD